MPHIKTSIFDIFKIGPGPSSSHTIGPMRAALAFRDSVVEIAVSGAPSLDVYLYGSLSMTGKGHGTDKAVLGGLLGWTPESCDCDLLLDLLEDPDKSYELKIGDRIISFTAENIHFEKPTDSLEYQNTLRFLLSERDEVIWEKEYYSTGGGFIKCKGDLPIEQPDPPHPYKSFRELKKIIKRKELPFNEIILQNEEALTGKTRDEILLGIDNLVKIMCQAVDNGLQSDGILPGPIGLMRKARVLQKNSCKLKEETGRFLALLNAYAHAASEENAAGRKVVTAPTSGAAGVIPGVIYLMKHQFNLPDNKLQEGMLAASVIAFLARHNASIAGAEVGCQGEVGVASAMAAALISHAMDLPIQQVENAAEIALEHQLGMTCDPIAGYVQIPCIERNAVGAVNAVNAYILSAAGDPARQKITFDEVVEAMLETGKDMSTKYKETSKGGLALCFVSC